MLLNCCHHRIPANRIPILAHGGIHEFDPLELSLTLRYSMSFVDVPADYELGLGSHDVMRERVASTISIHEA